MWWPSSRLLWNSATAAGQRAFEGQTITGMSELDQKQHQASGNGGKEREKSMGTSFWSSSMRSRACHGRSAPGCSRTRAILSSGAAPVVAVASDADNDDDDDDATKD